MVQEVSAAELNERIEAGRDVQVVDIRSPADYEHGHIEGAMNLPMNRFAAAVEEHDWGEEIVVACPLGKSSIQAARLLESYSGVPEGANVASLAEGYRGWEYNLETTDEPDLDPEAARDETPDAPF
jgi:rhodanese-related sulfurtransferase